MSSPLQSTDIPNFQYIFSDFTQSDKLVKPVNGITGFNHNTHPFRL